MEEQIPSKYWLSHCLHCHDMSSSTIKNGIDNLDRVDRLLFRQVTE